jgi:hypothetical protein
MSHVRLWAPLDKAHDHAAHRTRGATKSYPAGTRPAHHGRPSASPDRRIERDLPEAHRRAPVEICSERPFEWCAAGDAQARALASCRSWAPDLARCLSPPTTRNRAVQQQLQPQSGRPGDRGSPRWRSRPGTVGASPLYCWRRGGSKSYHACARLVPYRRSVFPSGFSPR